MWKQAKRSDFEKVLIEVETVTGLINICCLVPQRLA
jgi:hypothetical protein